MMLNKCKDVEMKRRHLREGGYDITVTPHNLKVRTADIPKCSAIRTVMT